MSFADRYGPWALVTGAARGLGAAFADEVAARGVRVLALDRDLEGLGETVARLRGRGHVAAAIAVDLAADDAVQSVRDATADRAVGLLVNNAAVCRAGSFFDHDVDELRRVQRINCEVPLLLTHVLGGSMRERGRGGIVLVSSLSMLCGAPRLAHYAATKAFGAILAEGLHEELRGTGVDAVTVLGPLMDTPGFRETAPTGPLPAAVETHDVARATLDALGRRGRVTVGRDGHVLTGALQRLLPHEHLGRLVAAGVRRMYPGGE
jgi:uncharacterized protein